MKKIKLSMMLLLSLVLFSCQDKTKQSYNIDSFVSAKGTEVFKDNWESMRENYVFPEWFQDAKFGIFIHWGIYSVPAFGSEWYARDMYIEGSDAYKHHVKTYGDHKKFGYKDFIPMFTAEKFDANQWVSLFKEAGAKYVVPVAEHHDGFAMYSSKVNKWNSVEMGPKQDFIAQINKAAKEQGIVFGLSTHRAENAWFYGEGMKFPSDVQDTTIALYGERLERDHVNTRFLRNYMDHTYELINKFEPKLLWFDWTVNAPDIMPYFNRMMAYYYNTALDWGEQVVVNTKYGYPHDVMVWDVERGKSSQMKKYPWQTDTSIGKKSWSYLENEENKTPQQIVHDLVDIVSKNGNLLLNIGPKVDGTITDEQQSVLRNIGKWLNVNGEAIYKTRSWVKYGEGTEKGNVGAFTDNDATPYTADDIRFTTNKNTLYATCLGWKEGNILIETLSKVHTKDLKIKSVSMLGSTETIVWSLKENGLEIQFPKNKPCDYAYSFKIDLAGMVVGDLFCELNDADQLESSDYIYLHGGSPKNIDINVVINGKRVKTEKQTLKPSVRNDFSYLLTDASAGLKHISLEIDAVKTNSFDWLFPIYNYADGWRFAKGDNVDWKQLNFDDQQWQVVKLPMNWETHSGYTKNPAYGWYRKELSIPVEWKGTRLIFPLGKVDDAGEIFFNGTSIGKSGEFPPKYKTAFKETIEVELPANLINYAGKNVIAIRVYDHKGEGGLSQGPLGPIRVKP